MNWTKISKIIGCTDKTAKDWVDIVKETSKNREEFETWLEIEAEKAKQRWLDKQGIKQITEIPPLPEGKYQIIYADPPWEYPQDWEYFGQNVKRHYKTISDDKMMQLPIKDLRADNCVLYMWATAPKLDVCIEVLETWGFDYKTCLVWDKVKHNMGFYASIRHEFLLIGGYGQSAPEDKSYANSTDSVYVEEKTEHSCKPEYYYEMIEKMHPYKTKKIELFARMKREGWDVWGDEI